MKTIIEPFKIKVIEPIKMTTRAEREDFIKQANYNVFQLRAEDVIIDLLTDSGTAAQSSEQMAALMRGDESYAGATSFYRFLDAVQELMPFKHIFPTHQGRAAERILATAIASPGARIPNNTFFDTTRANVEAQGMIADDLLIPEGLQPNIEHPFKGNMDIERLKTYLKTHEKNVPLVMLTLTNNAGGGQPVSMENIRAVSEVCKKFHKPLFIDSCRFAENAAFIKKREKGYANKSIKEIVQEIFSYADGMTMSAKKDPFGNIGGWLAMNDAELAEKCAANLILTEGFTSYGGLAGRDLDVLAIGLHEAVDETYLNYRLRTIEYFGEALTKLDIPILKPTGGHALFADARAALPHIPPLQYPGLSLVIGLYETAGIRACEIGTIMFGRHPDGSETAAPMDLVRLAMPRRVYTQSHIDYVIEAFAELKEKFSQLKGYKMTYEPKFLRHFSGKFAKLG